MNLGELLEELREGILHDTSDQVGTPEYPDQLWSDKRLVRYINEAQRRFARRSLILRDGLTPEVTQVVPTAGVNMYPLHPSVIAVISARCYGDRADLARAGHSSFDTYREPDTYFFDPSSLSSLPPGKVVAYDTDEFMNENDTGSLSVVNLRLYPPPDTANLQRIDLRVIRMPIRRLCEDRLDDIPEIPEDNHLEMLDWAAYLALRIVDRDQGDSERAQEFKASFEEHVVAARDVAQRKMFTPMQWGFGRNGFSYERD